MEAGFVDVAAEADIAEGDVKGVTVGGEKVILVKLEGRIFALGAVCTHRQGPLEEGWLEGDMIRCPWHNSGFDVRTGEAVKPPARVPEPCYEVRLEGGRVWVSEAPREAAG